MDELQVIVQQDPGKVSWNFDELKKALERELQVFQSTVYDDDSIKDAKKDVASLRKLRTAVDDKRKEIQRKCLEPFAVIDGQAKELMALIDKPISTINERVQAYETERRKKCKEKILKWMKEMFVGIPEDIASKAKERLYDPRWENATAKESDWKKVISERSAAIRAELDGLKKTVEEEFYEDVIAVYRRNLSYFEATQKASELREQKERILKRQQEEKERREREERERREQEEAAREEKASMAEKAAQEAARAAEGARIVRGEDLDDAKDARDILPHTPAGVITGADYGTRADATAYAEPTRASQPVPIQEACPETRAYPKGNMTKLVILGTEEQIKKVKNYIRFVGADFREV